MPERNYLRRAKTIFKGANLEPKIKGQKKDDIARRVAIDRHLTRFLYQYIRQRVSRRVERGIDS